MPPKPQTLPTVAEAVRCIDLAFLEIMEPQYGYDFYAYSFGAFKSTGLDREMIRGVLRSMSSRGLCRYAKGLWTEDGEPAGSGYTITPLGKATLAAFAPGGEVPHG